MSKYLSVLQQYKTLDINTDELRNQLRDILIFDSDDGNASIKFIKQIEGRISVSSQDVITVLNKFLESRIDEHDLQEWATFIRLYDDIYDFDIKDSVGQKKILIEILFKLSDPTINADIDETMVKYYLNCIISEEMPTL